MATAASFCFVDLFVILKIVMIHEVIIYSFCRNFQILDFDN